jgi:putative FmdB family regulatory protein
MPIYEYKCPSCGHLDEIIRPRQHDAPACGMCNEFHGETVIMERQISVIAGFEVKGFNAVNGYASPRTIPVKTGHRGMKVEVKGNPEAFK